MTDPKPYRCGLPDAFLFAFKLGVTALVIVSLFVGALILLP